MNTEPSPYSHAHHDRHTPFGLKLFGLYFLFYIVFMGLNTFRPEVMAWSVVAGLNLATIYGFTLIFLAFVLALVYLLGTAQPEKKSKP